MYVVPERTEPVDAYFARVGTEPLDGAIAALCETYAVADTDARAVIRERFDRERPFRRHLLGYVFRMASVLRRDPHARHVRGALLATAIEDAREDYRDTIVALMVLRWAALRVGVETAPAFEAVAALAGEKGARILRDVPERHVSQLEHAVKTMTARDWRDAF